MKFIDKKILKDLYKNPNGLFLYTFYSRYRIEPENIIKFINKYAEQGIVKYEKDKLLLTDKGNNLVLSKLNMINAMEDNKFSSIPDDYIEKRIEVNEPFLPNIKELSDEILNL